MSFGLALRCAGGGGFRLEGGPAGHGGKALAGAMREAGEVASTETADSVSRAAGGARGRPAQSRHVRVRTATLSLAAAFGRRAAWGSNSLPVNILVWRCGQTTATQAHVEHYLTAQGWRVIEDTSASEYVGSCAWG